MSSQKRLPHSWFVGVGSKRRSSPCAQPSPETLSFRSSQQATVEPLTSSASLAPCAQNQNKKIPTYFSNMFIQEKGWSERLKLGGCGAGGACGPCSAAQPPGAAHLTSRCWAPDPLRPLFTAPLWINPLSVRPEMLSGRQACVASHVSNLL